jgi:hypothetical protein
MVGRKVGFHSPETAAKNRKCRLYRNPLPPATHRTRPRLDWRINAAGSDVANAAGSDVAEVIRSINYPHTIGISGRIRTVAVLLEAASCFPRWRISSETRVCSKSCRDQIKRNWVFGSEDTIEAPKIRIASWTMLTLPSSWRRALFNIRMVVATRA